MKILRTPDKYFKNIKEYAFKPIYTNITAKDGSEIRIHHIDVGPSDGPILLAMHGQPVWSYLYIKMIPILNKAGIRVIAPDLVGYGKSDKPASRDDYSYQNQVDWMNQWLRKNDLKNLIFFGQDWGGLIGLRMIADNSEKFIKISMGNTGLPYFPNTSQSVIDEVKSFRSSNKRLSLFSMMKEVKKMDKGGHPALKFMYWQKYTWDAKNLPSGFLSSSMMEKRNVFITYLDYIFHIIGLGKFSPFSSKLVKAFESPFPSPKYKMGPRAMPSHVPMIPDQSLKAVGKARDFFKQSNIPFLAVFAGNDPVTNNMENDIRKMAPNVIFNKTIGGGHFFQWTKPEKLSNVLIDFIYN